jgi:phage regulator Rha-like protein
MLDRFPPEFMMQLNETEWKFLRSQIATSNNMQGGRKYLPYVFTEHGVLMLSCILNSKIAIQVNLQLVRLFIKLRESLTQDSLLSTEIKEIKAKLSNHDKNIELVFSYLDELVESREKPKPRKRIGYMPDEIG